LPDFATEEAVFRADFTTDWTDFFAPVILLLWENFLAAGFLAAVFFAVGLRSMDSSSQWLPRKTRSRKPRRSGDYARAKSLDNTGLRSGSSKLHWHFNT
jgi:hypothetical protein